MILCDMTYAVSQQFAYAWTNASKCRRPSSPDVLFSAAIPQKYTSKGI